MIFISKTTAAFKTMHRRRRMNRTDYRTRLKFVKSKKIRIVIRKSLSHTRMQFIEFNTDGDKTIVTACTSGLGKFGWKTGTGNLPSAYLVGLLAGKKAKEKNITEAILDIGLQRSTKGNRIYAALKGLVDSGININHDKKMFPSDERISGKHIKNFDVDKFEEVKKKILSD